MGNRPSFTESKHETEIKRVYNKIKEVMKRKDWKYRDFSIYLNTDFDHNFVFKRVQDKFWFTSVYYYNMGVVSMEYSSFRNIRRIGIHLERRFSCF